MLEQTRYSYQTGIRSFAVAELLSAFVVAAALLTACQPIQPVEVATVSAGVVMAAETAATPDVADDAGAEDEAADADRVEEGAADVAAQPDAALVEAGMAVYRAQYCGICHEFTAAGTTGSFGPTHDGLVEAAALRLQDPRYIGPAETVEEYLFESIVKPDVYIVEGYVGTSHAMPPYTHLTAEDVRALVALLMAGQ